MKYLVTFIFIILWCLVLGKPVSLLLSSLGFWIVVLSTVVLFKLALICVEKGGSIVKYIGLIGIFILILSWIAVIFIPYCRNFMLVHIGMQDQIIAFNHFHLSFWDYLFGVFFNIILIPMFNSSNSDD